MGLSLPEAVVHVALNADGKRAMAGNRHRRMGNDGARLHRRRKGRFDVIHQFGVAPRTVETYVDGMAL